jgi:outer membrane protein
VAGLVAMIVAGLAGVPAVQAGDGGSGLGLAECIERALASNPSLVSARAEAEGAGAAVRLAERADGLQTSLGAQVLVQGPVPQVTLPDVGTITVMQSFAPKLELTFALPLDTSGAFRAARQEARAGREGALARYELTRDRVVFEVIRAYVSVLRAEDGLAAAESAVIAADEGLRVTQAQHDAGRATALSLESATNALAQTVQRRDATANRAAEARAALVAAIGEDIGGVALAPTYLEPDAAPDPLASIEQAEARRPELSAALADLKRAAAARQRADAEDRPEVSLFAGGTAQRPSLINEPLGARVGLSLTWSLFDSGREDAMVDQAEAGQEAAEGRLEGARDAIELEVQRSMLAMDDARRRREVVRALRSEAEGRLAEVSNLAEAGAATPLNVRQAEAALAEATFLEEDARHELSIAYATFVRATGGTEDIFMTAPAGARRQAPAEGPGAAAEVVGGRP